MVKMTAVLVMLICSAALACTLFACAGAPTSGGGKTTGEPTDTPVDIESDMTDEMFSDDVAGAVLHVFQFEGRTYTTDHIYDVAIVEAEPLEEGGFYEVVADVTYLNGGIAGYVDYPEIDRVISCKPVSPFDLGLPSTAEMRYGLTLIGDYADGDVLLYEFGKMAVWKNGVWVYRYDKTLDLADGTTVLVRSKTTQEAVEAGIAEGVLSCEDYFVLPAVV